MDSNEDGFMAKSGLVIGIIVVMVAAGVIGYFVVMPIVNGPAINLVKDGKTTSFGVNQIEAKIAAKEISLINKSITLDGQTVQAEGVNPCDLYFLAGWYFVDIVDFKSDDGATHVNVSASDFMLGDSNYNSKAVGTPSMLVYKVNGILLAEYNASLGDYLLLGDKIGASKRVNDVRTLTYLTNWELKVKVNNVLNFTIGPNNVTTLGNQTSYNWDYKDYSSGKEWYSDPAKGFTLDSLAKIAVGDANYNLSGVAIDGYGSKFVFTKAQLSTTGFSMSIQDASGATVTADWGGRQALLCYSINGTNIAHLSGPYRLVIPGYTKDRYINWLTEIKITV